MIEYSQTFILSQAVMFIAMIFDFIAMQRKKREQIFLFLIISTALISAHYLFLGKYAAGIMTVFSIFRFVTCYLTANKKFLALFILLNSITLFITYKELFDLVIYFGIIIFIIGNFQTNLKKMRLLMMSGTFIIFIYNILIISPMGAMTEGSFFISHIMGYYKYFIKNKKLKPE